MFGIVTVQYNSSSEIFSLQSCGDEDDDDTIVGRILTTEELVERFKNREDLFGLNVNRKLHVSEIFALLFALLAGIGSTRGHYSNNTINPGAALFSVSMNSFVKGSYNSDVVKSMLIEKKFKPIFDLNSNEAVSEHSISDNRWFTKLCLQDSLVGHTSIFVRSVPRAPPMVAFDVSGKSKYCCCSLIEPDDCTKFGVQVTDKKMKIMAANYDNWYSYDTSHAMLFCGQYEKLMIE